MATLSFSTRAELLESCVMFPDDFLRAVERFGPNGSIDVGARLKRIAVVLRPKETAERYEKKFQLWLKSRRIQASRLQDDPEEVRLCRQCFAYVRASTAETTHWHREETRDNRSPSRARSRKRSVSIDSDRDDSSLGLKRTRHGSGDETPTLVKEKERSVDAD
ncbi:unnamed protein product [Phytophthora lilii]|uniref:Unnamed protein product n=1 Tax=Phytophthora lilii TaxID=2077276 RepID=A0A9W6X0G4_9STRA|nr:unnamed protein product [Phytophthora lilii]